MGGSGNTTDWNQVAYDNGYAAAQRGQSRNQVQRHVGGDPGNARFLDATLAGFDAARSSRSSSGFEMPTFEMPAMPEPSGPSYEEQLAAAEKRQGISDRDNLYGNYITAAQSATDFVNAEIATEQQNARLLGIDYAITDDIKSQRIGDYFSTVWGEGDQQKLEALMGEWGNPEGFDGFTVQRGTGGKYANRGELQGEGTSTSTSKGIRPDLPKSAEEEEGNVLGL